MCSDKNFTYTRFGRHTQIHNNPHIYTRVHTEDWYTLTGFFRGGVGTGGTSAWSPPPVTAFSPPSATPSTAAGEAWAPDSTTPPSLVTIGVAFFTVFFLGGTLGRSAGGSREAPKSAPPSAPGTSDCFADFFLAGTGGASAPPAPPLDLLAVEGKMMSAVYFGSGSSPCSRCFALSPGHPSFHWPSTRLPSAKQ
jgi:hypothetical protein